MGPWEYGRGGWEGAATFPGATAEAFLSVSGVRGSVLPVVSPSGRRGNVLPVLRSGLLYGAKDEEEG